MSADNWTNCPMCDKERAELIKKNVHSEIVEFDEHMEEEYDKSPLAEWFNWGVDENGEIEGSYSCSCHRCEFKAGISIKKGDVVK